MKKYYAVAPKEGEIEPYLTNGKRYEIIDFDIQGVKVATYGPFGRGFTIEDDNRHHRYCLERGCSYLNDLDWTIVEEEQTVQ